MLGFSPTGSTPLGGSGNIEYSLSANGITTSVPSLQSSSVLQVHSIVSDSITTAQPSFGIAVIIQLESLLVSSITTGQPTVGTPDLVHNIVLTSSSINTNQPVVNSTLLSKFDNRVVDINSRRLGTSVKFDDSNNVVINYSNNKVKVG